MSDSSSTGVDATASQGRSRSRRQIREAERAAEREAIMTGQQPLLTRKEMRRLRQEAEALQAAVDAGEITLEEARALQDPLAEQPNIDVPLVLARGAHAVQDPAQQAPVEPAPQGAGGAARAVTAPQEAAPAPQEVAPAPQEVAPAPQAQDGAPEVQIEAVPQATQEEMARAAAQETGELSAQDLAELDLPAPVPTTPEAPEADGAQERSGSVPVRRPIVRIPGVAQGVRTVNHDTGELEAIRPVEDEEEIETPQWKALNASAVDELASPEAAPQEVGAPEPAQGEAVPAATEAAVEPTPAPAVEAVEPASVPVPDWDEEEAAGGATGWPGPSMSSVVGTAPATVAAAVDERTWQDVSAIPGLEAEVEEERGVSLLRVLLAVLLVIVLGLVLAAGLWALFFKNGSTGAVAATLLPLLT